MTIVTPHIIITCAHCVCKNKIHNPKDDEEIQRITCLEDKGPRAQNKNQANINEVHYKVGKDDIGNLEDLRYQGNIRAFIYKFIPTPDRISSNGDIAIVIDDNDMRSDNFNLVPLCLPKRFEKFLLRGAFTSCMK